MENRKARVVMLALSGLLFGISGLGWCWHNARQHSVTESAPEVNSERATTTVPDTTAPVIASNVPPVYPATSYEEAARAARASVGAGTPAAFKQPARKQLSVLSSRRFSTKVPPPPNMPGIGFIDPPKAVPPSKLAEVYGACTIPAPLPRKALSVNDVRLVGVIEGRGIFKVRRDVARELGIEQAFTLGKGDSFDNIQIVSVDAEQATVRDGTTVATKPLSRVH